MSTKRIGDKGEEIAVTFLEKLGYVVLERNYRYKRAEIDIVCIDPTGEDVLSDVLVFVEVKTRSRTDFGRPEEAVSKTKKRNLIRAAEGFIYERQWQETVCRFDVISIIRLAPGKPEVKHFKHAFYVD